MSKDKKERVLSAFGRVKIQDIIEGIEKAEDTKLFTKREFYVLYITLMNNSKDKLIGICIIRK